MTATVRKAVFPVAGLGTRTLPATKAIPKEMLPIVDKPLIQYAVDEAVQAGVTELIFVTGRAKRAIEDHFDKVHELESELEARGKRALLEQVQRVVPDNVSCVFIRQAEARGLGHAVLCARAAVGDNPFAVILPDDVIDGGEQGATAQMVDVFAEHRCSVLAVEEVAPQDTEKYGVVKAAELKDRVSEVQDIVEKPKPDAAPSNLGVVGRYVLTPGIFDTLEQTDPGAGGEIQLTDAIHKLMERERVLAFRFTGRRFDCGNKLGYMEAIVEYGLKHPEIAEDFRAFMTRVLAERLT